MFPFQDVNKKDLEKTTEALDSVMRVREFLTQYDKSPSETKFEAIALAVEYLKTNKSFNVTKKTFVDCLGSYGEGALYALAFGFSRVISVELTKKTKAEGQRLIDHLKPLFKGESLHLSKLEFEKCFFNELDVNEFDCLVIDFTLFRTTLMDEGTLVSWFLDYCASAKTGSFLVMVTTASSMNLNDYYDCPVGRFHLLLDADIGLKAVEGERQGSATVNIYEIIRE